MDMLTQAADKGEAMPLVQDMTDALRIGHCTVSRLLADAEKQGMIRLHTRANGVRRVEILATGKMTDWNHAPGLKKARVYRAEALPKGLQEAKLWIQRRGYPVHRAKISDPKADPTLWVIGSLEQRFSDNDLMTFARRIGWQQGEGRTA